MILRFFTIVGFSECLAKSDKQKGIFYLKSTLKAVAFFEKCKNEIRTSFYNTIFCNTTIYFYVGQAFGSITVLLR